MRIIGRRKGFSATPGAQACTRVKVNRLDGYPKEFLMYRWRAHADFFGFELNNT